MHLDSILFAATVVWIALQSFTLAYASTFNKRAGVCWVTMFMLFGFVYYVPHALFTLGRFLLKRILFFIPAVVLAMVLRDDIEKQPAEEHEGVFDKMIGSLAD